MKTNNVKLVFNKALLQVKKYSPEIMVGAGIVGAVASGVLACKATLKVNNVVSKSKESRQYIEDVHTGVIEIAEGETYTEDDYKKDITINTVQTGVEIAKLYAPAVSLAAVSIASILGGQHILKKRYVASVAAYTAVNEGFKEYRGRVIERFGKDVDTELKTGIKAKKIDVAEVDENGETKMVKKKVNVVEGASEFARYFNSDSHCWEKNFDINIMFLRAQEQLANDILHARGHIFLNEVYDMLGMPHTQAGQVVGWVYDPNNTVGDNYVDFSIPTKDDIYMEHIAPDGEKKYERAIPLDFNVDGYVLELI